MKVMATAFPFNDWRLTACPSSLVMVKSGMTSPTFSSSTGLEGLNWGLGSGPPGVSLPIFWMDSIQPSSSVTSSLNCTMSFDASPVISFRSLTAMGMVMALMYPGISS